MDYRGVRVGNPHDDAPLHTACLAQLSKRELEVLQEIVDGRGPSAFAERLYISHHTARTHVKNVLMKMGAHSVLEAASIAVAAGLRPSCSSVLPQTTTCGSLHCPFLARPEDCCMDGGEPVLSS